MAGERVTNLKVLKGYLYADVRLGHDANGAETIIGVRLSTSRAEVQEALEPLYELLRSTGRSLTIEAATEAEIKKVRDEVEAEVRAAAPAGVEARVEKHTLAIEHALRVISSVGPRPQDGYEDFHTPTTRRSGIKQLREALARAGF